MIVYMLRSLYNGRYYERVTDRWLEQDEASVWFKKLSIVRAKQKVRGPSEIVPFTLKEIK